MVNPLTSDIQHLTDFNFQWDRITSGQLFVISSKALTPRAARTPLSRFQERGEGFLSQTVIFSLSSYLYLSVSSVVNPTTPPARRAQRWDGALDRRDGFLSLPSKPSVISLLLCGESLNVRRTNV